MLGAIWLIDGLLQLQPQMFTMNMISGVMRPMSQGQPGMIAHNLQWITQISTENLDLLNIVIAAVQVGIGVLLLTGVYVRAAVIASAVWALIVWYGGEGMSMLLTGQAGVLTGAPGAILLYPIIGFAVYPRDDASTYIGAKEYAGLISRRQLQLLLGALWVFFALLQLQPFWWQEGQIDQEILGMVGMGGLDSSVIDPTLRGLAGGIASGEIFLNVLLMAVCLAIGIGLLLLDGRSARPVLVVSIVVSLLIWWFAQALGGILSGMSTDFNSGLLLVIMALGCWPREARAPAAVLAT